jgi:hypothetical protein
MNRKLVMLSKRANRMHLPLVGFLLFLLPLSSSFANERWVIREDGMGPLKVGMSLTELKTVLHQELSEEESGSENCFYLHARGHAHLALMIEDGRLSRIDVDAPGIATSTGIQVGDSEQHLRQVYGAKLRVTEHKYIDTGHYFTARSPDRRYGVRFETDKGKVLTFYAGRYESIQYVEGCV